MPLINAPFQRNFCHGRVRFILSIAQVNIAHDLLVLGAKRPGYSSRPQTMCDFLVTGTNKRVRQQPRLRLDTVFSRLPQMEEEDGFQECQRPLLDYRSESMAEGARDSTPEFLSASCTPISFQLP